MISSVMPSYFDGDFLFVLPTMSMGVPCAYGCSMNGINKMCDVHPWYIIKSTNIQNDFALFFRCSSCVGHLQYINKIL